MTHHYTIHIIVAGEYRFETGPVSSMDSRGREPYYCEIVRGNEVIAHATIRPGGYAYSIHYRPMIVGPDGTEVEEFYTIEDAAEWAAHKLAVIEARHTGE